MRHMGKLSTHSTGKSIKSIDVVISVSFCSRSILYYAIVRLVVAIYLYFKCQVFAMVMFITAKSQYKLEIKLKCQNIIPSVSVAVTVCDSLTAVTW